MIRRPQRSTRTDTLLPYTPLFRSVVVAVQNFKGGVSKSTTGKHLADYLALRGYRVLVVDCDPQASMSVMFDVNLEALVEERSEEHTSELQSLMRISYAVFCLK